MISYLIRRVLLGLLTLTVITMLVYVLIRNMPGTALSLDTAESDPSKQISNEDRELLKKAYGLDKPVPVAYAYWLGNLVRGDLGTSFRTRRGVLGMMLDRLPATLLLSITSFVITTLVSIPLGLYVTKHSGDWKERSLSIAFYALYSLPVYVAGLFLLYVFYLKLQGTPFQLKPGMVSDNYDQLSSLARLLDLGKHLILPLFCYSYGSLAFDTRFIKANMEEAIRQDYIRTARAKGLEENTILWRHAFRNTLIPFVTLLGYTLPGLIGGSIILEQIFNWPGVGRMYYEAITFRDYPVIMGLTFIFAVATLLGQLMADLLYAWVDPRVTYQ